ncbi:unnamed protein product [Owenia fusiformis]|uniref:CLIC N-terminal domain-containing protein n=1 Tax=Owenia fusiformis TaxID=6347 RepID=A0A8J1US76_OWEFU|nr:unnamed protein product [Owenia fusiformis]
MSLSKGEIPPNDVELLVKAGKDGKSRGACPFCQRMHMILLLKCQGGDLQKFTVTTVNMSKPPADFIKKISSRLPVLIHGNEIVSDNDEIVQYIDDNFPSPSLAFDNKKANEICLEVFSKFSYFTKEVSHSSAQLLAELRKINNFLDQQGTTFLCGDYLTHLDCEMLPKLQHIRVVAKAFKNFEIPSEFTALWRYLNNAYSCETFKLTCPSDQEIVHHWTVKPEMPHLPRDKENYYSTETPERRSFDVPIKKSINGEYGY